LTKGNFVTKMDHQKLSYYQRNKDKIKAQYKEFSEQLPLIRCKACDALVKGFSIKSHIKTKKHKMAVIKPFDMKLLSPTQLDPIDDVQL
jgi:hypothetical protein